MPDYLAHALHDAGVVELRHDSGATRWTSGLFTDRNALDEAIRSCSGSGNLYTSLHAPENVPPTNAMGSRALADADFGHYMRLPFDFDPVRPVGVPSTDVELARAVTARNALVAALGALGWPSPANAKSGNGAHCLYRCRLPNTAETREMLATLYRGMAQEFSNPEVRFDPTVRNPSRIWRLYGSINRKGTNTEHRPHRTSSVWIPHRWEAVSPKLIEERASYYANKATRRLVPDTKRKPLAKPLPRSGQVRGDFVTLDPIAWFQAHGLYKRYLHDGMHSVTCPWEDEHSSPDSPESTATVIWEAHPGRWPSFDCKHAHCDGRTIIDVMNRLGDVDQFCSRPYRRQA